MAGLNLVGALDQYQQGVQWKQGQDENARALKQRDAFDAANKAASDVIAQAKAQYDQPAPSGEPAANEMDTGVNLSAAPKPAFKLGPDTLLKAYDVRGQKLAEAGQFEAFAQNEARVAPIRQQVRQQVIGKALQAYEADQDPVKLAKTVYDDGIFDGKTITNAELVKGGTSGVKGAPSGGDVVRFTLSDGSVKMIDPSKVPQAAMAMMRDPKTQQELMEFEYKERLKSAMALQKDTQIEGVKHKNKVEQIGLESAGRAEIASGNRASQEKIASGHDAATRYSADQRVESASKHSTSGGGRGATGLQSTKTDADGYVLGVYRDGTVKRLMIDNKPVRSGDWSKRVDDVTKELGKSLEGIGKSQADLRAMAEQQLVGKPTAAPAAPGVPATGGKDYSTLWK